MENRKLELEKETFTRIDLVYRCLADKKRTESFRKAIEKIVKPDDIVVDLGTGTGILALFAARAGAKKVYAIEISNTVAKSAYEIIKRNGYEDIIEVIVGDASKVKIPKKVNVVISEMLTTGLIDEDQIIVLNSLWDRDIVDNNTIFLPKRIDTYAELVQSDFDLYGFDMKMIRHEYPWLTNTFALPLTSKILLDSIDLTSKVDEKAEYSVNFISQENSIANSIRLSSIIYLTTNHYLKSTSFLNAPVIIPIKTTRINKNEVKTVEISYKMGAGFQEFKIFSYKNEEYIKAKKYLIYSLNKLRKDNSTIINHNPSINVSKQQNQLREYDPNRFVIGLNTIGCSYALNKKTACFHCGQLVDKIHDKEILKWFFNDIDTFIKSGSEKLFVCTNGSWFDEKEISLDIRSQILDKVLKLKNCRELILETRPECVNDAGINQLKKLIKNGIKIKVGLSLDSLSYEIRDLCINKPIPIITYVQSCEKLYTAGIEVCTYILFKPPFLTELEAIEESIKTINYVLDINESLISLEPITLQDFTLQKMLEDINRFRVPWNWSIREIIYNTKQLDRLSIGGNFFIPKPKKIISNCSKCDNLFQKAYQEFNKNKNAGMINLTKITCDCIVNWKKELIKDEKNILNRVLSLM